MMTNAKREYMFRMPDGTVGYKKDIPSLPEGERQKREKQLEQFALGLAHYERIWRNEELSATDWMLVSDATYGGEPLSGSTYLQEILDYRQNLRKYNLTTDARPERPEWFA